VIALKGISCPTDVHPPYVLYHVPEDPVTAYAGVIDRSCKYWGKISTSHRFHERYRKISTTRQDLV